MNTIYRALSLAVGWTLAACGIFWLVFFTMVFIQLSYRLIAFIFVLAFALCFIEDFGPKVKALWNKRFTTYEEIRGSLIIQGN